MPMAQNQKKKNHPDLVFRSVKHSISESTQYRSEQKSPHENDGHFMSKGDHGVISEEST